MQCHPQWTLRRGPAVRRWPALYIQVSIDIGKRCIHGDLNKREQTLDVGGGSQCVRICVCCVCVTFTYSGVDIHPSIRTHIYSCKMIMYVEVWIIMVCNLDIPDPNKQEQPPDVAKERQWHLSDFRGVDFLYSFFFGFRATESHSNNKLAFRISRHFWQIRKAAGLTGCRRVSSGRLDLL